MSKVAVVYWSGTGNTEAMANQIVKSVRDKGNEADLIFCTDFSSTIMDNYDAVAFGCPAMGDEVLEEEAFEPMFEELEDKLNGKKIAIFGSYEWNDGQWMIDWEKRVKSKGANLVIPPVTAYGYPDANTLEDCNKIGDALV